MAMDINAPDAGVDATEEEVRTPPYAQQEEEGWEVPEKKEDTEGNVTLFILKKKAVKEIIWRGRVFILFFLYFFSHFSLFFIYIYIYRFIMSPGKGLSNGREMVYVYNVYIYFPFVRIFVALFKK